MPPKKAKVSSILSAAASTVGEGACKSRGTKRPAEISPGPKAKAKPCAKGVPKSTAGRRVGTLTAESLRSHDADGHLTTNPRSVEADTECGLCGESPDQSPWTDFLKLDDGVTSTMVPVSGRCM